MDKLARLAPLGGPARIGHAARMATSRVTHLFIRSAGVAGSTCAGVTSVYPPGGTEKKGAPDDCAISTSRG